MRSALWRGLLPVTLAMSFPVAVRAQVDLRVADGLPTFRVQRGIISMKAVIFGSMGCKMTVYLDNIRIVGKLGRGDDFLNEVVMPTHVAAMEIYPSAVMAPPQYQSLNGTCGVVLIWTK